MHIHSPDFREEFYPLVRHDEIHLRLFSLHLWLLSDRLKHSVVPVTPIANYWQHKRTLYVICGRRFPSSFYSNQYENFQDSESLPSHLFQQDFTAHLNRSNSETYKSMTQVFQGDDYREELKEALLKTTLQGEFRADDPMCDKLCVYMTAHRNYLASLTMREVRKDRINWGLKE